MRNSHAPFAPALFGLGCRPGESCRPDAGAQRHAACSVHRAQRGAGAPRLCDRDCFRCYRRYRARGGSPSRRAGDDHAATHGRRRHQAVRSGAADIGFVAPNPERTGLVLYSQTYMLVQQSALVRADSRLHFVNELDRPGHVIGINTDDSVGVWLQQHLTAARVRATADYTLRDAVQWLQNGEVVAFAGGRQRLSSGTRGVTGLRMLDDNFYGVPQTVAVPLERPDRLRLIDATLAEMRSSGFLADSIARSGIEGLTVAPADPRER